MDIVRSLRLGLFFLVGILLGAFSVASYSGDRYLYGGKTEGSSDTALARCALFVTGISADWVKSACADVQICPSSQDGGSCNATADVTYRPYGNTQGITNTHTSSVLYSYCPDSAPKWNGTQCVKEDDKCKPMKGLKMSSGYVAEAVNKINMSFPSRPDDTYEKNSFGCQANCRAVVTKDYGGATYDGRYYGTFELTFDGTSCNIEKVDSNLVSSTPERAYPKDSDEKKCIDSGKAFGYVNENVMCVEGEKKKAAVDKTTTTSTPDGGKKEVKTETSVKCDGSVCITETTTTTTTINSSGTVTGTTKDTKTETTPDGSGTGGGGVKESSFCKENPSSPMCKEGAFSGTCDAEPKCSGDAVFCATAKATWQTKCALDASKEVKDAGAAVMAEGGDEKSKEALKRTEKDVSELARPESGGGGGGCVPDRTVSFGTTNIVIPFSSLCGGMAMMRAVLLAVAGLTAAFIIIGGVK